jgi:hypothetical protein
LLAPSTFARWAFVNIRAVAASLCLKAAIQLGVRADAVKACVHDAVVEQGGVQWVCEPAHERFQERFDRSSASTTGIDFSRTSR